MFWRRVRRRSELAQRALPMYVSALLQSLRVKSVCLSAASASHDSCGKSGGRPMVSFRLERPHVRLQLRISPRCCRATRMSGHRPLGVYHTAAGDSVLRTHEVIGAVQWTPLTTRFAQPQTRLAGATTFREVILASIDGPGPRHGRDPIGLRTSRPLTSPCHLDHESPMACRPCADPGDDPVLEMDRPRPPIGSYGSPHPHGRAEALTTAGSAGGFRSI